MKDRYSFWHKIMPILLVGERDEVEELRVFAKEAFEKVAPTVILFD